MNPQICRTTYISTTGTTTIESDSCTGYQACRGLSMGNIGNDACHGMNHMDLS